MGEITERQRSVVKAWMAAGSVKGAAGRLGLASKTVEYHLTAARYRLGIGPLMWLAVWATKNGMVPGVRRGLGAGKNKI